jgi:hypothetical protein
VALLAARANDLDLIGILFTLAPLLRLSSDEFQCLEIYELLKVASKESPTRHSENLLGRRIAEHEALVRICNDDALSLLLDQSPEFLLTPP